MDQRLLATHPDLLNIQMDIQRLQAVQQSHSERLARLEKRQADDAALKSVWGQPPFPSVLGGTPQQGPMRRSSREDFDDFEEQGQNLIGSLHLEADDEPVRRVVAASRANSVRFDESALQGANWGQNSRHSGDFGPIRPGSGIGVHGMMERSLSHKSDGRHSSAGHSVHSIHSAPSGRASSLGLDTNFVVGSGDEDSPIDIPEPSAGLMILGPVPSIVRCWLTQNFGRDTLLYAAACTGSQKSTIEHSLVKELDLTSDVLRDVNGVHRIQVPVYLTEAIVTQRNPRTNGTSGQHLIPSMATSFEVVNIDQPDTSDVKAIRVVLGSDTLRSHSADLFFSRNTMTLLGDQREKLTVPFVRPEDEGTYKFLATANMVPGKPKLNANAAPFVSSNNSLMDVNGKVSSPGPMQPVEEPMSPATSHLSRPETGLSNPSENGGDAEQAAGEASTTENKKDSANSNTLANTLPTTPTESSRRESAPGSMWGPWRQGSLNGSESSQKDGSGSGGYHQPAQRSSRSMKILKPSKLSSSARTGASYELPPQTKATGEARRKSTAGSSLTMDNPPPTPVMRWDSKEQKRTSHGGGESRTESKATSGLPGSRELRSSLTRSANPVGGASAFKWMSSPGAGSKVSTAAVAD